ncbi:MAG: threonylcarbamoyl-AMP synthase [Acidobacteria bacterium]|nr:threonylcarbamoyl-AMP synthase [Acidobacteriota bacterium]
MVSEQELDRAAALLREGNLVAIPTETVYGLAANALDPTAVARIYETKGRPSTSPLIVHVAGAEMARTLTRHWPAEAETLAAQFWPGPLTMVLPKAPHVPDIVTAGLDTVGIRMPSHPIALDLIRRAGIPIAAPSANRFTALSPTNAQHVRESFGDNIPVLDGGPCEVGIESTVISLAGPEPILLRPGILTLEQLENALQKKIAIAGKVEGAHPSPGMHHKHYAPRTPVYLVRDGQLPNGKGAYLWFRRSADADLPIPMPADPIRYARILYEALHRADHANLEFIAVEEPPQTPEWSAVNDRLTRAASDAGLQAGG